jgi:hypothetical protein
MSQFSNFEAADLELRVRDEGQQQANPFHAVELAPPQDVPPTPSQVADMGRAAGVVLAKAALHPDTLATLGETDLGAYLELDPCTVVRASERQREQGNLARARALWDVAAFVQGYTPLAVEAKPVSTAAVARKVLLAVYQDLSGMMVEAADRIDQAEDAGDRAAYLSAQARHDALDRACCVVLEALRNGKAN